MTEPSKPRAQEVEKLAEDYLRAEFSAPEYMEEQEQLEDIKAAYLKGFDMSQRVAREQFTAIEKENARLTRNYEEQDKACSKLIATNAELSRKLAKAVEQRNEVVKEACRDRFDYLDDEILARLNKIDELDAELEATK